MLVGSAVVFHREAQIQYGGPRLLHRALELCAHARLSALEFHADTVCPDFAVHGVEMGAHDWELGPTCVCG